jgi:hypothetical protein
MRSHPSATWNLLVAGLVAGLVACDSWHDEKQVPPPGSGPSPGAVAAGLSDTLEAYAQKCDAAIGVTVPDFDCGAGTEVPTTHFANNKCDRPNRLNTECDPGSRFQVLVNNANAYVVAHCRRRGEPVGQYQDIAVIQHNKKNGATCFYQALQSGLPGVVKAPSKGTGAYPWLPPVTTASINCVGCHDNGPLIRTPYLTQITGANALPGKDDLSFNRNQPYRFIGADFASWKAFKVEVSGNPCIGCHRMAVNSESSKGTALDLGIRATAISEAAKNPHSVDSPIWMTPGQITFSQANADAALAIKNCGLRKNESPLPNTAQCRITQYTGLRRPLLGPSHFTAALRPTHHPEIEIVGWSFEDYQEKDLQLRPIGWRLSTLQPYVENDQVLYNAVWTEGTEEEVTLHGATPTDFEGRHTALHAQGKRLKFLQPYVLNGQVLYTAVWTPGTATQEMVLGASPAEFQSRHAALTGRGYALALVQPYVVGGVRYYSAVWTPSTQPQMLLDGLSPTDFQARYEPLMKQGWRLAQLEPSTVAGAVSYTALLRQGAEDELHLFSVPGEDFLEQYETHWEQGWRLKFLRAH